jgi:hypothetical protein
LGVLPKTGDGNKTGVIAARNSDRNVNAGIWRNSRESIAARCVLPSQTFVNAEYDK